MMVVKISVVTSAIWCKIFDSGRVATVLSVLSPAELVSQQSSVRYTDYSASFWGAILISLHTLLEKLIAYKNIDYSA